MCKAYIKGQNEVQRESSNIPISVSVFSFTNPNPKNLVKTILWRCWRSETEEMSTFDAYSMDGEDTYGGYGSYSNFSGAFPGDADVTVDHTPASPDVFGFDDSSPNYSQPPFDPIHVENGNGNGYGVADDEVGDAVFVSDGPILPPPSEMGVDEGYALLEWRR